MAGQHVVLNTGSTANCFYAAGETVALRGSAKSAALAGDTVTIDGTVDGDVEVWADKLILGKNARITGTVNAHVSQDPERAERPGRSSQDRPDREREHLYGQRHYRRHRCRGAFHLLCRHPA